MLPQFDTSNNMRKFLEAKIEATPTLRHKPRIKTKFDDAQLLALNVLCRMNKEATSDSYTMRHQHDADGDVEVDPGNLPHPLPPVLGDGDSQTDSGSSNSNYYTDGSNNEQIKDPSSLKEEEASCFGSDGNLSDDFINTHHQPQVCKRTNMTTTLHGWNLFKAYMASELMPLRCEERASKFLEKIPFDKVQEISREMQKIKTSTRNTKRRKTEIGEKPMRFEVLWRNVPGLREKFLAADPAVYPIHNRHKHKPWARK